MEKKLLKKPEPPPGQLCSTAGGWKNSSMPHWMNFLITER